MKLLWHIDVGLSKTGYIQDISSDAEGHIYQSTKIIVKNRVHFTTDLKFDILCFYGVDHYSQMPKGWQWHSGTESSDSFYSDHQTKLKERLGDLMFVLAPFLESIDKFRFSLMNM